MMRVFGSQRPPRQPRGWTSAPHPPGPGHDPRTPSSQQRELPQPEQFPQSPLRYRWFGGGYRPEDVELLLAECRLGVRQLERRVAPLRERERELQDDLGSLRGELADLRSRQSDLGEQVAAALSHADRVEQLARDQAVWLMHMAEREAPAEDGPEAAPTARAVDPLMRMNEELLSSAQTLEAQLKHLDETLHEGEPAPTAPQAEAIPAVVAPPPPPAAPEPVPDRFEDVVYGGPPPERVRPEEREGEAPRAPDLAEEATPVGEGAAPPPFAESLPEAPLERQPSAGAETVTRFRPATDVLALREELSTLELRRQQAIASRPRYLAPVVLGLVAAGLAAAVGLAVAGYATAAVALLAAFALAIAALSTFGIGRAAAAAPPPREVRDVHRVPPPQESRHVQAQAPSPPAAPEWPVEEEPEPEPSLDPEEAQRELARELGQLARERARRRVELGDAVEFGDEASANRARSRLRELDSLMTEKEAEIESTDRGLEELRGSSKPPRWQGRRLVDNLESDYDEL